MAPARKIEISVEKAAKHLAAAWAEKQAIRALPPRWRFPAVLVLAFLHGVALGS